MNNKENVSLELEALPPDLRDLTLWARIVADRERIDNPLPQSRPWNGARVASPQRSILRPGESSLPELDAARQHRTIHLLIKPDKFTCYRQAQIVRRLCAHCELLCRYSAQESESARWLWPFEDTFPVLTSAREHQSV